ncbi:hypothetical protein [Mesoplasma melaleucae]|uniref:hypothetical protein n=1 Tax=Mesoplasma melaleucae TaxID=81459 RepID=UPI0004855A4B|nr:hypothetical protein [Mesoplasma melaleucae]
MKNKEAWKEAFEKRTEGWGNDVSSNLQNKSDYYIEPGTRSKNCFRWIRFNKQKHWTILLQ